MDETSEINKLTYKIIGCAMQVLRTLGNEFDLYELTKCRINTWTKHRK